MQASMFIVNEISPTVNLIFFYMVQYFLVFKNGIVQKGVRVFIPNHFNIIK
jgi:hypothetical protein